MKSVWIRGSGYLLCELAGSTNIYLPVVELTWFLISEKDGKAIQLSYKEKLRLVAYTKQAAHGKYRNDVSPDVGFLDVVGNDRR